MSMLPIGGEVCRSDSIECDHCIQKSSEVCQCGRDKYSNIRTLGMKVKEL